MIFIRIISPRRQPALPPPVPVSIPWCPGLMRRLLLLLFRRAVCCLAVCLALLRLLMRLTTMHVGVPWAPRETEATSLVFLPFFVQSRVFLI
jgi:hypothetical protein